MKRFRSAGVRKLLIFVGLALLMGLLIASPAWGQWILGVETE